MHRSRSVSEEVQEPDPPFWTKTSWLQLGYGVWVNMTVMGIGLSFGFAAVTIPQLRDETSPIKMTLSDEAWIVSVLTLSSPIGSLLCGVLMDRYGRKPVLVLCEIPMCFGWFYTGFAVTAKDIMIGRLIAGIGIGMAITAPRAYITEITLPNMRGVIGALPNLFISLGLTIQAGLGSFLTWTTLCYICGCYTIIMMFSNIFLPDTPYFLLLKATDTRHAHAKSNLRMFRSSKFNIDAELEALYDFRNENNIRSLSFKDQIIALFRPSSCKPYGIATVYIMFMQLAGVNVVIMWAVEMLETAKTSINSNLGNFILALTRIAFGFLTSVLLFKVGRRVMAIVSAVGVGVVALSLCLCLHMNNEKSIFPQLLFMAYIAFATLGYYTLPFLMMFELLPLQIRGLLSGICISQLNLMMFGMNNGYPFLRQRLGLANTMAMFGGFSLLGALILYFILPETKGLTLQEIEEFFNTRRPSLVSQRQVMSDQLNDASRMSFGKTKSSLYIRKQGGNENKQIDSIIKLYEKKKPTAPNAKDPRYKTDELKAKQKDLEDDVKEVKEKVKDLEKNEKALTINDLDLNDNTKNLEDTPKVLKENEDVSINDKNLEKNEKANDEEIKDDIKDFRNNPTTSKEYEDEFIDENNLTKDEKDLKKEYSQIEEKNKSEFKDDSGEKDVKDEYLKNEDSNLKDKEMRKDEEERLKEVDMKEIIDVLIDEGSHSKDAEVSKETESVHSQDSKDSATSSSSRRSSKKETGKGVVFKKSDD